MKTSEYICTTFAIAGILFVFTLWTPDQYEPLLAQPDTQMICPDVAIKHSVGGNLKTGVQMVDKCASYVNVFKFNQEEG